MACRHGVKWRYNFTHSQPQQLTEVSSRLHTSVDSAEREKSPGTHAIGWWKGSIAGLDAVEKTPSPLTGITGIVPQFLGCSVHTLVTILYAILNHKNRGSICIYLYFK